MRLLKKLRTLLRTLCYLRMEQLVGQLRIRYQRRFDRHSDLLSVKLDLGLTLSSDLGTDWICPIASPPQAHDVEQGRWTFLRHTEELGCIPDWSRVDLPKLWLYNLHYHEFLWDMDFTQGRSLVEDYLQNHGPLRGHCGWEPYPITLRIMAWGAWFYGVHRSKTLAGSEFDMRLRLELYRMGIWLSTHMETHLGANHLLENALALAFLAGIFNNAHTQKFHAVAEYYVQRELPEQIGGDGAHYERSPMYQQRLLLAVSWAALASQIAGNDHLSRMLVAPVAGMATCLATMVHPDGEISLFQDAAIGSYPVPSIIFEWLHRRDLLDHLPVPCANVWLANSGYAVGRNDANDCLFVDFGGVTPSYQPGHAHAAWGTFELSVSGKRFVIDAGNYDYLPSKERKWARSTEAHSTIQLAGQNQAELWGAFRMGRRGKPFDVTWTEAESGFELSGRHSAYKHLSGSPIIARKMHWNGREHCLDICDWIEGGKGQGAVSRLWIDGDWSLRECEGYWEAELEGSIVRIEVTNALEIIGETYPRFGERKIAKGLLAPIIQGKKLLWDLSWGADNI